jgi:hypothetical protein
VLSDSDLIKKVFLLFFFRNRKKYLLKAKIKATPTTKIDSSLQETSKGLKLKKSKKFIILNEVKTFCIN